MRSERAYCLYGTCFTSYWRLPYAQAPKGAPREIRLVPDSPRFFSDAAIEAGWLPSSAQWFHQAHLGDGSIYLRWNRHFEFVVSPDGDRIAGRLLSTTSTEAFHAYLLGQVLSYALLKRGEDPLHGTAVVVDGAAIAFLGDCGHGKSTLAAAFLGDGNRLLTDDLLVVKRDANGVTAYPGPPRIKLSPSIAEALLEERSRGIQMNQFTPKLVVPLQAREVHSTAAPLKVIYLLTPQAKSAASGRVTIRSNSPRRGFFELLKNTFNAQVTEPERLERQFRLASQIVSTVPIKSLSYRRRLSTLAAVRESIRADLVNIG
ncbi:MAG: hypothetical protein ABJA98_06005 [Acidobacteriota bacterium]